jgi:kynureninase
MQSAHQADPLLSFRDHFPLLRTHSYLANCSQAPLATSVRAALETFLASWADRGMNWESWMAEVEGARILRLSALVVEQARALGLAIGGPQSPEERGATTALDVGSPERAHRLEEALRQHSIVVSARGRMIRVAPHGFTREMEVMQALITIARLLKEI